MRAHRGGCAALVQTASLLMTDRFPLPDARSVMGMSPSADGHWRLRY